MPLKAPHHPQWRFHSLQVKQTPSPYLKANSSASPTLSPQFAESSRTKVTSKVIFQDNLSTIQIVKNARPTSQRTERGDYWKAAFDEINELAPILKISISAIVLHCELLIQGEYLLESFFIDFGNAGRLKDIRTLQANFSKIKSKLITLVLW